MAWIGFNRRRCDDRIKLLLGRSISFIFQFALKCARGDELVSAQFRTVEIESNERRDANQDWLDARLLYDNAASEHLVLVFPDAMGPDSGRTKANCVKLSADYKVALVDITPEYLTDLSKVAEWVQARPFESLLPKVHEVVRHFKSVHSVNKIAALGYCWGAWIAARYSGVQANDLSAAISFHPSWFLQDLLDGEERSGIKIAHDITVPHLILTAGNDRDWLKPGGDVERILKDRGIPAKLREFPNVAHGWMNRSELTEPAVAAAFQAAWDEEALPFLREYLK